MKRKPHKLPTHRSGIILLVVLGALTFFSLLVATYVVFSNESREASFALSQKSTRAPDVNWVMNEALMTLIRGTSDTSNPFFGEDLLSDYYGHDGSSLQVKHLNTFAAGPQFIGDGFLRFPVATASSSGINRPTGLEPIDDVYAGTLITFTEGPLQNQTYRVIRSVYRPGTAGPPAIPPYDDLYIELKEGVLSGTSPTASSVRSLFYADPADLTQDGFEFHLNGTPRNSRGIGFDTTTNDIDVTTLDPAHVDKLGQPRDPFQAYNATTNPGVGFDLPAALQPNHLGRNVDKSAVGGDFDEGHDAPDFNNWFLSHRRADGTIIPSFHRPAVINYILNERTDWDSGASATDVQNLVVALSRGTFRPLAIAPGQIAPGSVAINQRFTGGSNEFALRSALRFIDVAPPPMGGVTLRPGLLDQLIDALINGEWDVDNDFDGTPDSNWMDFGLPTFTSREGKLIRPLVAPMIEDLGGRLNLNAHGNGELSTDVAGSNSAAALWAGAYGALGAGTNARDLFRGLGWGPAEIMLPATSSSGAITNATIQTNLTDLLNDRYQYGEQQLASPDFPGISGRDTLDLLRFGYRPTAHTSAGGFGYSTDPFGRGGLAMGRSGHIVAAGSGIATSIDPSVNEAVDNPYEMDPSGYLAGDRPFTLADLEVILRSNEFDSELLPQPLRERVQLLIENYAEFSNALTTDSASDDHPPAVSSAGGTPFLSLIDFIEQFPPTPPATSVSFTQAQWRQLIAPELRLGRKLDVNRRFGNLVDDDGDDIIDEPSEVAAETNAYTTISGASGTIPSDFNAQTPNYTFDEPATAAGAIPVTGRQLLARHLYILLMALSRDLDTPSSEASFPSIVTPPPGSFSASMYKARRLAQWAVNVVDYRDPDSIMTRFVFDDTPFDGTGWSPPADMLAAPAPADHVVWGVEEPQLVFSESAAYHDVRLRDIDRDDNEGATKTDTTPDDDSDQVRIPQGSLFLELYCPHPVINAGTSDQQTKPGTPQELYTTVGATGASELELARNAPAAGGGVGAPVWRIAITERHNAGVPSAADAIDPAALRQSLPDSASFEVTHPDELDASPAATLSYDRFILFRDFAGADTNPDGAYTAIGNLITANAISDMQAQQVFFAPSFSGDAVTNSDRTLEAGQFLVLAPRLTTRFGSKEFAATVPGLPSDQRFAIFPNEGLVLANHTDTRLTPTLAAAGVSTPALPMVVAAPRPTGWAIATPPNLDKNVVGLSVSEPLPRGGNYYPQPTLRYNGTQDVDGNGAEDYLLTDSYIDFSDPATLARDTPLDVGIGRVPIVGIEPALGTVPNYCSAFLQRLADPTLPYNAVTNPYRTVDWLTIDLTVFSGEERETNISGAGTYTRQSRQRNGDVNVVGAAGPTAANALYSYETDFPAPNVNLDSASPEFFIFSGAGADQHLQCSFSFLNTQTANINPSFVGFANTIGSDPTAGAVSGNDRNLPQTPYAVHPWLNRPFASQFELMMVPACSQGRLFEEFSFDPAADPDVYPTAATPADPAVFNAPFRHLLNFFHSNSAAGTSLELARLFDYVHTLPRFRGEVELINPQRLDQTDSGIRDMMTGNPTATPPLQTNIAPPFSIKYDNTRQGTINLNTISEFPVWAGLMQGHLNDDEFTDPDGNPTSTPPAFTQLAFDSFIENRRGFSIPTAPMTRKIATGAPYNYDPANLDPGFPTEFAGVFRSATDTPKAPALRNLPATALDETNVLRRRSVHGSLLRGALTLEDNETPPAVLPSLFVRDGAELPVPTTNPEHDRFRNAFMRYQTLIRMPNLASDNSQIFLIRMTLGFFEVDAATQTLQNEYNADIGQNTRYHATFVVDRSIPVGFIPGEDLNARDIVIFESYQQ